MQQRRRTGESRDRHRAPDPVSDANDVIQERGDSRDERELGADVSGDIAEPIDPRPPDPEAVFREMPCDHRDVTLTPAPLIDERLCDVNQAKRDPDDSNHGQHKPALPTGTVTPDRGLMAEAHQIGPLARRKH